MEDLAMQQQTAAQSGELDSLDMDAEHVMPPELPTQDSALEDSVGQLSRVQNKLVDTLHSLCLLYTSPSPRDRTRSRMPSSA